MDAEIYAVIVAVIMSIPGILAYAAQRKQNKAIAEKTIADAGKSEAETAGILTGAASSLVVTLRTELQGMRCDMDILQAKIDKQQLKIEKQQESISKLQQIVKRVQLENEMLRSWAKGLTLRVIALGGVPDPEPNIHENQLNDDTQV